MGSQRRLLGMLSRPHACGAPLTFSVIPVAVVPVPSRSACLPNFTTRL